VLIGCFFRILFYAVDPDAYDGIFSLVGASILFDLAIIVWLDTAFMMALYWIELQLHSGIRELQGVQKLRPVLYVSCVLISITVLPVGILNDYFTLGATSYTYNALLGVYVIGILVFISVVGYRLMKVLDGHFRSTRVVTFKIFLQKITRFLLGENIALFCLLVLMGTYSALGRTRWDFIGFTIAIRTFESTAVFLILVIVNKKKPEDIQASSAESAWRTGDMSRTHSEEGVKRTPSSETVNLPVSSDSSQIYLLGGTASSEPTTPIMSSPSSAPP